uniref:Uncharacterized protein n=1 Tax=Anguilla anguilla TaxID=7936 RepID=A0A0E9WH42_ANGAN
MIEDRIRSNKNHVILPGFLTKTLRSKVGYS